MAQRNELNAEYDPLDNVPVRTMEQVVRGHDLPPARDFPATPRGAAIIPAGDGVRMGRFTLLPVGLTVNGFASAHEWEQFYLSLKRVTESLQWATADWLLMGERQHGKSYTQMAALTGLKEKTLRDYAYVASNVDLSIRIDKLTFAHHQLVVAMPPDVQRESLLYAAANKLSVGRFRAYLDGHEIERVTALARFERKLVDLYERSKKRKPEERQTMARLLRQMADALEAEHPPGTE